MEDHSFWLMATVSATTADMALTTDGCDWLCSNMARASCNRFWCTVPPLVEWAEVAEVPVVVVAVVVVCVSGEEGMTVLSNTEGVMCVVVVELLLLLLDPAAASLTSSFCRRVLISSNSFFQSSSWIGFFF